MYSYSVGATGGYPQMYQQPTTQIQPPPMPSQVPQRMNYRDVVNQGMYNSQLVAPYQTPQDMVRLGMSVIQPPPMPAYRPQVPVNGYFAPPQLSLPPTVDNSAMTPGMGVYNAAPYMVGGAPAPTPIPPQVQAPQATTYGTYGYMAPPQAPPQMAPGMGPMAPMPHGMYMPQQSIPGMQMGQIPQGGLTPAAKADCISQLAAEDACSRLYTAFKGVGTNDREVINVLSSYNKCQLNRIATVYKQKYGKTLVNALKSEISGNYLRMALAILYQPFKMEAHFVSEAIRKRSVDDPDALLEILATRTNVDLMKIANTFQTSAFDSGKKSKKVTSFKDFILQGTPAKSDIHAFAEAILLTPRSTEPADPVLASRDARDLILASKGMGTDAKVFFNIFAHRSFDHINAIAKEIVNQKKITLEKLIKKEFSRSIQRALLYVLYNAKSPAHGQAYIIYKAVKGAGTRDDALIRAIAYIYDTNMLDKVKSAFKEICGKDMVDYVESDTSFNYRKLCIALLNFKGKVLTTPMNVGYK